MGLWHKGIDEIEETGHKIVGNEYKNNTVTPVHTIKAIITDLDGVLTCGGMFYKYVGNSFRYSNHDIAKMAMKRFHTRDAAAARWLSENTDVKLFVMTAGDSEINNAINIERMKVMYLTEWIHQGVTSKVTCVKDILDRHEILIDEVAYIGDDRADREVLQAMRFTGCPKDALGSIKHICDFVSERNGGEGVLADLVDTWVQHGWIQEKEK